MNIIFFFFFPKKACIFFQRNLSTFKWYLVKRNVHRGNYSNFLILKLKNHAYRGISRLNEYNFFFGRTDRRISASAAQVHGGLNVICTFRYCAERVTMAKHGLERSREIILSLWSIETKCFAHVSILPRWYIGWRALNIRRLLLTIRCVTCRNDIASEDLMDL